MKKLDERYVGMEISSATLLTEDLIESFMEFLDATKNETHVNMEELQEELEDCKDEEDKMYFLNETLCDVLNEIAPEGTYFGSHVGDGACFGFWEPEEWD